MQRSKRTNLLLELEDFISNLENNFCPNLLNLGFSKKEIAEEVYSLLEYIRMEQPDKSEILASYWRKLYIENRMRDNSVKNEELSFATTLIFEIALVILASSENPIYTYEVTDYVLEAIQANDKNFQDKDIVEITNYLEPFEEKLTLWIDNVMNLPEEENVSLPEVYTQSDSPFAKYICLYSITEIIINCLHRLIESQTEPKEQLAPLKAAMEYSPKLVMHNVPVSVFNEEFKLSIAETTYNNWIKGHHGFSYKEGELSAYKEIFQFEIPQN